MRDQPVPLDRFFSTAGCTTCGTHNRSIDAPEILVDSANIDACCAETAKELVQRPVRIPFVEQPPTGFPSTEFLRQVAPG
jgi:hypothetical protein